jgi:hypothetical protein
MGALKEDDKKMLIDEITSNESNINPKEVISISFQESANMCANMFNVLDENNNHCVIMSKRAHENFDEKNLDILYQNYKVVIADIDIIENIGGGSARCMLVELF